jgi:cysteinyl-tRNA synthetase
MDDDFNSGGAMSDLFQLLGTLNKFADQQQIEDAARRKPEDLASFVRSVETLRELSAILGLFLKPPAQATSGGDQTLTDNLIKLLIDLRAAARKNKDFATADRIRNDLAAMGVTLEDRKDGTGWRIG